MGTHKKPLNKCFLCEPTICFLSEIQKKQTKKNHNLATLLSMFACVEVLWPSQPNGVMPSAVSLPNHTFTGQA